MKKQLVSFVIPCYRSAETIGSVVDEIEAAMGELERYEYEIILVNDCSPDDTFGKIRELCGKDKRIKGISGAKFWTACGTDGGISSGKGRHPGLSG
jgi:glycosyltransferase involved in cell wall biosynthesis